MDSLHAIGFYVSAALAGVGGILLAFLPGHWRRGLALGATGLGVAGIYASLSAGFAAIVVLVCYLGCALLVANGPFNTMTVARLLFAHDALATDAVAGLVLAALVGAAIAWRRERPRDEREGRR